MEASPGKHLVKRLSGTQQVFLTAKFIQCARTQAISKRLFDPIVHWPGFLTSSLQPDRDAAYLPRYASDSWLSTVKYAAANFIARALYP